jgi:hypothetical protein
MLTVMVKCWYLRYFAPFRPKFASDWLSMLNGRVSQETS